jgi:glycosyltransferase involved in cell wall biosynthesis
MAGRDQLRILFLFPGLNCYGVAKSMLTLSRELVARGHSVYCGSEASGETAAEWVSHGIRHIPMPLNALRRSPIAAAAAAILLVRTVRRERVHLVHSHHRRTSLLASLVGPMTRRPLITTSHGRLHGRKWLSCWGSRVICVSEDAREHMIEHFGASRERTVVIHNGIDVSTWRNLRAGAAKPSPHAAPRPVYLANIAKLSEEKDQATLLRAMPSILGTFPRARLRLVGAGRLKPELKLTAQRLGIEEAVDFVGEVGDVRPILELTDVFVLCSTTEGLPMSLLEAMAAGVSVVVTEVGGMPRLVRHRSTGCLAPAGDAHRLAEEICFVLSNPDEAEAMRRRGQALVEREFSAARMAREVESVYRDVLAEWNAP